MSYNHVVFVTENYPSSGDFNLFQEHFQEDYSHKICDGKFDHFYIGGVDNCLQEKFGFTITQKKNANLVEFLPWALSTTDYWYQLINLLYNDKGCLEMDEKLLAEKIEAEYVKFLEIWKNIPDDYWVTNLHVHI